MTTQPQEYFTVIGNESLGVWDGEQYVATDSADFVAWLEEGNSPIPIMPHRIPEEV